MGKLNFDDMNKVAGGKLDIVERDGKFKVIKEYENEFSNRDDAQKWLDGKAEKCLDRECGKNHHHGNHSLGILPFPHKPQ